MAIYTVTCEDHGENDAWIPMETAMRGEFPCPVCEKLGSKIYTAPADHSDNNFKSYWSDQLSSGRDPVRVNTKGDYRDLMRRKGLQPYEAGMAQEKARTAKRDQSEAIEKTFRRAVNEVAK